MGTHSETLGLVGKSVRLNLFGGQDTKWDPPINAVERILKLVMRHKKVIKNFYPFGTNLSSADLRSPVER